MADGAAEGASGGLPPIGPGGVPLADYVRALLGPMVRMAVHEPTGQVDVQLPTPRWFSPPLFSADAVTRLHDALAASDPDTGATRLAHELGQLWRDRSMASLPLAARMATDPAMRRVQAWSREEVERARATPDKPLSEEEQRQKQEEERFTALRRAQMLELRRLARERDLRVARLCDALRAGHLVATGFLPGDVQRRDVPIAAGWWGDADLVCAWHDGELRPREGAPAETPCFRGVRLAPAVLQASDRPPRPRAAAVPPSAAQDRPRGRGRPSSVPLLLVQMNRRAADGQLAGTVTQEARQLLAWLEREHQAEPRPALKSLVGSLGAEYGRLSGRKIGRKTEN